VINRTSDSSHRFSYPDGVMTNPSNALDLSCHYYWETFDGNPPPWSNTGPAKLSISTFATTSRPALSGHTDVLGSEELHSKEDLGLITCRGIGCERYAI
jgi:hypothetical protein